MADEHQRAGTDASSPAIDMRDETQLRQWAQKLDATPEQLKEAIGAVGPNAADVEAHLKGSRSSTNSERVARETGGSSNSAGEGETQAAGRVSDGRPR